MIWTRLYDPERTQAHWTEIVRPEQYVVFVRDADSGAPRDRDGRPFCSVDGAATGVCAALCEDLGEARYFAREVVASHPKLCCEIYDSEGKCKPAQEVVYDPSVRDQHVGVIHARRQSLVGAAFVCVGVTLVAIDASRDLAWIWGYVIGLKCLLLGGIFLTRGFLEWREYRHDSRDVASSARLP